MAANDYNKDKQAKIDTANALRARQDHLPTPPKDTSEVIVPKTFKQKWDNYWYHYKYHTFGIIAVIILFSSLFLNILIPQKYDASLTLLSQYSFEGASVLINEGIDGLLDDYDNNKKISLNLSILQVEHGDNKTLDPQVFQANQAKLLANLSVGDQFLFMIDQANIDYLKANGIIFADLTQYSASENIIDKTKYSLKDTHVSEQIGLTSTLDDMYLCLIDKSTYDEKRQSQEKFIDLYTRDENFLKNMIFFG